MPTSAHLRDARRLAQLRRGDRLEVEHPPAARAVAAEDLAHLIAGLVAAATGPGADHRLELAAGAKCPERPHALRDHAAGQPPPATMEHRHTAGASDRDRQAIRHVDRGRNVASPRRDTVAVADADPVARLRLVDDEDVGAVHLARDHNGLDAEQIEDPGLHHLERLARAARADPQITVATLGEHNVPRGETGAHAHTSTSSA